MRERVSVRSALERSVAGTHRRCELVLLGNEAEKKFGRGVKHVVVAGCGGGDGEQIGEQLRRERKSVTGRQP